MNGLRKMVMENKHLNRIIFASTASLAVIVLLLTYILSSHYETMASVSYTHLTLPTTPYV